MSTEDPKRSPEAPHEAYDRILKYVKDQPFGSAEYQAISDYMELQSLYATSSFENKMILRNDDKASRLRKEREARITDFRLALLQDRITQCESRVPGYSAANSRMYSIFESELPVVIEHEAAILFPEDNEKREKFITNQTDKMYSVVQDVISKKRGDNLSYL